MRIQDVIMHLLLKQPFYGYIAASVTPAESSNITTIDMNLTPIPKLLYNREWFESLKEDHAIGVVMHELLHMMLLHPFRKGNRERCLWIIACDMAVNEHIESIMLPEDAVTVDRIAKEINETIPRLKSAEFYYDIVSKSDDKVSFLDNDKEIKIILRNRQELKANNCIEDNSTEINKNAVRSMLSDLVDQANAEGEIPQGVSAFISEIYTGSEVNWRNVLKRFLSGKGKVLKRKTYKRESKRFENLPGNKRSIGVDVLLALDESGSISEKQVAKFYNELLAIKRITSASISVTQFDTECTEPISIERYIRNKERLKSGGTDFRPVFKLADRIRMPLLIIFTDGDGIAPEASNQKVLWVLTKGGKKPSGFGHYVVFES